MTTTRDTGWAIRPLGRFAAGRPGHWLWLRADRLRCWAEDYPARRAYRRAFGRAGLRAYRREYRQLQARWR